MAEPTWTWGGLRRGDPYSQGTPGKPMPAPPGGPLAPGALGTQANPYRIQGQGGPGEWWQRPVSPPGRPGQFGFPQAEQLPQEIGPIRQQMQRYEQQPTPWQQEFNQMNPGFSQRWQGVFNMPQRGEDPNAPFDFNVGPQMASAPLGEGLGPSAPWAAWKPAQAEDYSVGYEYA